MGLGLMGKLGHAWVGAWGGALVHGGVPGSMHMHFSHPHYITHTITTIIHPCTTLCTDPCTDPCMAQLVCHHHHHAPCHAPTHALPSLPVIPKLNPAPSNLYPAELQDTAATASLWRSVKAAKDLNTTWTEHHLKQVIPPEWKDQSGLAEQFFCIQN